jgi:negative regulator of flagellin synthesis FlgM
MNTTISSNGLPVLPQAQGNAANSSGQAASTASSGSAAPQADDSVRLTDSARALQQASSSDAASSVNSARVEQIRQSLANGTYQIDAGKIADKLTSLEGQISGKP